MTLPKRRWTSSREVQNPGSQQSTSEMHSWTYRQVMTSSQQLQPSPRKMASQVTAGAKNMRWWSSTCWSSAARHLLPSGAGMQPGWVGHWRQSFPRPTSRYMWMTHALSSRAQSRRPQKRWPSYCCGWMSVATPSSYRKPAEAKASNGLEPKWIWTTRNERYTSQSQRRRLPLWWKTRRSSWPDQWWVPNSSDPTPAHYPLSLDWSLISDRSCRTSGQPWLPLDPRMTELRTLESCPSLDTSPSGRRASTFEEDTQSDRDPDQGRDSDRCESVWNRWRP